MPKLKITKLERYFVTDKSVLATFEQLNGHAGKVTWPVPADACIGDTAEFELVLEKQERAGR